MLTDTPNAPLLPEGVAVFRALRKGWPHIPVLLASGYSEEEVALRFKGVGLKGFIQKPFSLKCLENEVQRVLKSEIFPGAR